jgi:hypothetical protein
VHAFQRALAAAITATTVFLPGCGGSGPGQSASPNRPPPVAPPPAVNTQAYRFLNQATFGTTEASAQRFGALDDPAEYARWIDEQLVAEPSLQLPYMQAVLPNPVPAGFKIRQLNKQRVDIWLQNVMHGDDQLRQRVAWALSQIMVVSQVALAEYPLALPNYDTLSARHWRFPHADAGRDAASDDGRVPLDARQSETGLGAQYPTRRKLRARVHAAVHRRPRAAQSRRHAAARLAGPADSDFRSDRHRRLRERVHGLAVGLRRRLAGQLRIWKQSRDRRQPGAADAGVRIQRAKARSSCSPTRAARTSAPAGQDWRHRIRCGCADGVFNHPNVGPFMGD